jgi:RNA polymerase sigma-70 factor (ECF subfamily)
MHQEDHALAQSICMALANGEGDALVPLYNRFHRLFIAVCRRRLVERESAQKVENTFWLELLTGKAICSYEGKASLQTYLLLILARRCHDENRKVLTRRKHEVEPPEDEKAHGAEMADSPEEEMLNRERSLVLAEALAILEEASPRDAALIRMHLSEMDYRSMALAEMGGGGRDEEEIHRKTAAVKKQFTRPNTGAMAKFRAALTRVLLRHGLEWRDLL